MEDKNGCIRGLWDGIRDGSTLYRVGVFLKENGFNSVRIPLAVKSVRYNTRPNPSINTNSNRAIDFTTYSSLIRSIVQGLQQFQISVVLDFHVLSPPSSGISAKNTSTGNIPWENSNIRIKEIKESITTLADLLCSGRHWNVLGIDLLNEPDNRATWGDNTKTDWRAVATELGNHLLSKCPQWLVFVQGIQKRGIIEGQRFQEWAGASLSDAVTKPIKLSKKDKVVYFPPFYTPSKSPEFYFYDGPGVELGNEALINNVNTAMDGMFGDLLKDQDAAVVLSSFGGLYGDLDQHPLKTSQRVFDTIMSRMTQNSKAIAGGYFWTLNPDALWPYSSFDNANQTVTGLVDTAWRAGNLIYLRALEALDKMPDLKPFPCEKD